MEDLIFISGTIVILFNLYWIICKTGIYLDAMLFKDREIVPIWVSILMWTFLISGIVLMVKFY